VSDDGQEVELVLPPAFDDWYRQEWPRVVALVRTVTLDLPAAEDIAASAFYKAFARYSRLSNPSGWVRTVALNAAKRHRRPSARLDATGDQVDPSAEQDLHLHQAIDLLSGLTPNQRAIVALRYVYDLTQAQIADELSLAPGTVAAVLSTSRRKLHRQISEEALK